MSTDVTSGVDGLVVRTGQAERRRAAPSTRMSWASPVPFSLDDTDDSAIARVSARAEARRSSWTVPLLRRLVATDALLAAVVIAACVWSLPATRSYAPLAAVLGALTWVVMLAVTSGYDSRRVGDGPEEFGSVLRSGVAAIALLGVVSYAFELLLPRRDVLVAAPVLTALTLVGRYVWRRWLHAHRASGGAMLRTLVVGEPAAVSQVVADLNRERHHGLKVVGACVPVTGPGVQDVAGVELLGLIAEVPQVVVDNEIDNVLVVGAQLTGQPLRRLSWALERTGADLMVAPGLVEVTGPYVSLHPVAGLSLLRVERPAQSSGRLLGKTILDRTLGGLMFLAAVPIIAVGALAVAATSRGPAFFAQQRIGRDGEAFTMWKLRSMVVDAEQRRAEIEELTDRDGPMFKMHRDPRITPVGRFIRRWSVDELPQLWNVVKGHMSLVGPRPPLPSEYEQYHDATHRRVRVKPGLTGLWQVSGRADLPWEESVRLDLRYVDNWSAAMDLQILWKTGRAVLRGSGAY